MRKEPIFFDSISKLIVNDISIVISDFDGVFTDNSVWVDENGIEQVKCSRFDGIGISKLKAVGVELVVVSTEPNKVVLDRMPNPHIGFGFGIHNCLGAPQARLIIRSLLRALCEQVKRIELISFEPRIEKEESYTRQVGYDRVVVKIN